MYHAWLTSSTPFYPNSIIIDTVTIINHKKKKKQNLVLSSTIRRKKTPACTLTSSTPFHPNSIIIIHTTTTINHKEKTNPPACTLTSSTPFYSNSIIIVITPIHNTASSTILKRIHTQAKRPNCTAGKTECQNERINTKNKFLANVRATWRNE